MASGSSSQSQVKEEDDDDVDFMSDEFLEQCTKNDVRPGLIFKQSEKRKHEQIKRGKERKTVEELENTQRDAGLKTEIGSDNKGFQMMKKMGFKAEEGIGKRTAEPDEKLKTPIPVVVKRGRWCLGENTLRKEKQAKKEALGDVDSFRTRLQTTSAVANTKWDLNKAQRICQNLDEKASISEPPFEPWFWPAKPKPKTEDEVEEFLDSEESDDDVLPESQQLEKIVDYLRTTYFFCIWCGTAFDDEDDLTQSCPGLTREDH